MCSFLDLLDFHKMAQEKKISVWKGEDIKNETLKEER